MSKKTAVVLVDYPMQGLYHAEDTEWITDPDEHDPGILGSKPGAKPVNMEKKNGNT